MHSYTSQPVWQTKCFSCFTFEAPIFISSLILFYPSPLFSQLHSHSLIFSVCLSVCLSLFLSLSICVSLSLSLFYLSVSLLFLKLLHFLFKKLVSPLFSLLLLSFPLPPPSAFLSLPLPVYKKKLSGLHNFSKTTIRLPNNNYSALRFFFNPLLRV